MRLAKGFSIVEVVIVIVVLAVLAAGGYLLWQRQGTPSTSISSITTLTPTPTPTPTVVKAQKFFYRVADVQGQGARFYAASVDDFTPHKIDLSGLPVKDNSAQLILSPDGTSLAILAKGEVFLYRVNGFDARKPEATIVSTTEDYSGLIWSKDSQHIAYIGKSSPVDDPSGATLYTVKIYAAEALGKNTKTVKTLKDSNGAGLFAVTDSSIYWYGFVDGGFWGGVTVTNYKDGSSKNILTGQNMSGDLLALSVTTTNDLSTIYAIDRNGAIVRVPTTGNATIFKAAPADGLYYSSLQLTSDQKSMLVHLMTQTKTPSDTTDQILSFSLTTGQQAIAYDAAVAKADRTYDENLSPDNGYLWMAGNNWYQIVRLTDKHMTSSFTATSPNQVQFIGWTQSY